MGPPPAFDAKVVNTDEETDAVCIKNLAYSYPSGKQVISDFSLNLPPGSRCLLSGANGAGACPPASGLPPSAVTTIPECLGVSLRFSRALRRLTWAIARVLFSPPWVPQFGGKRKRAGAAVQVDISLTPC